MKERHMMIAVQGLFETHLTTSDLDRSVQFYRDVIGLRFAHLSPTRSAVFFWVGSGHQAMLGIWAGGAGPQQLRLHTAFRVSVADVLSAPVALQAAGVTPLDFDGARTTEPVVLAWMPAVSVFFRDPDGHLLEYIAMLPDEPQPQRGVVPWSAWMRTP
jgi:lactoylglutathione lyase